jgi:hypothetical protein
MARAAQSQASNLQSTAAGNAANYGSTASGIQSNLLPFLTRELNSPQGYSQQDITSMLSQAEGGAGGATSGVTGQANLEAARTGNTGGFQSALDSAARSRQQAGASASEGIAANDANLKQSQQQQAAQSLQGLYGANTNALMSSLGLQSQGINDEVNAGNSGWLQQALGIANTINGGGQAAGSILKGMS